MILLGRWQRRYMPAAAVGSAWRGVVFTWSGCIGLAMVAIGWSIYAWSGLPILIVGALMIGGIAANHYDHAMAHLRPSLTATDEEREVAKLKFEAELRKSHVRGGPPSIVAMFAIQGAAAEAQQIGVPVEDLQAIADRLHRSNYEGGDGDPGGS